MVLKAICSEIGRKDSNYLKFLKSQGFLQEFIVYLFRNAEKTSSTAAFNLLAIELKLSHLRSNAIE